MVQTVLFQKIKFSEKIKIQISDFKFKNPKTKNRKFQKIKIPVIYTRTHTRVRAKKCRKVMFLCMYYAIKCRNIAFKGIFSPVERILWCFPYKLPQTKRKRLRTL